VKAITLLATHVHIRLLHFHVKHVIRLSNGIKHAHFFSPPTLPNDTASEQLQITSYNTTKSAKMATFDPADPDAFFNSAMAELNGNQASIQNDDGEFVDAPEHQLDHDTPMDDFILEPSNSLAVVSGDSYDAFAPSNFNPGTHIESQINDQIYTPSKFDPAMHIENQSNDQISTPSNFDPGMHIGDQSNDQINTPSSFDPEMQTGSQSSDHIITAPVSKGKQRQNLMPFYNTAAEPAETINVSKQSASEKHTAAYLSIFKKPATSSQGEHSAGCSNTRGASTPPTTPPHQPGSGPKTDIRIDPKPNLPNWEGPDDLRDVSRPVTKDRRWHAKVAHLHPDYALPSHRYWIGVLNPDKQARNACKEHHFTWMKGNKYTTVETVRRVYATTTMAEGVLITVGERPKDEDRVDSLDYFNDKIVLFSIVDEDSPEAVGREITEGLVTQEPIALDD
jgi:hypothetical protein